MSFKNETNKNNSFSDKDKVVPNPRFAHSSLEKIIYGEFWFIEGGINAIFLIFFHRGQKHHVLWIARGIHHRW